METAIYLKDQISILIADDDAEDRQLISDAFSEANLSAEISFANDGVEAMEFLRDKNNAYPSLILLDLNMPRKDGRETLKEIKSNAELRHIPVVVLTTSQDEVDIWQTYNLGANSFLMKPPKFTTLVDSFKGMSRYWFEIVELPKRSQPTVVPL
ncbi:MAG: response regulator [Bdellovibrionales bacterium]